MAICYVGDGYPWSFPTGIRTEEILLVAIDHFTKWIEALAVPTISEEKIEKFFKNEVICRFGIPHTLITDNGKQFDCQKFRNFCDNLGIKLHFSSVAHPQTNGQTENANRTLLDGIKKRVDDLKGAWVEELYSVLWAYRTTPRKATGESPFRLAYGMDAMIPAEVTSPSWRVLTYDQRENELSARINNDLLQERREQAALRADAYRQQAARYHDKRVRIKHFKVGDLILRRADVGKGEAGVGKLGANWEGPYEIIEVIGKGAYKLASTDGTVLPRTWNAELLRKYYQ